MVESSEQGEGAPSRSSGLDFPPFPRNLYYKHKTSQEVPSLVRAKLQYQYELIELLTRQNSSLAHSVCHQFLTFCLFEGISLPAWLKDRFCNFCFALLLPTLTSHAKIIHHDKRDVYNKRRKPKVKCEIVIVCGHCHKRVVSEPAFAKEPPNQPQQQAPLSVSASTPLPTSPVPLPLSTKKLGSAAKVTFASNAASTTKPFSFLNKSSALPAHVAKGAASNAPASSGTANDSRRKSAPARLGDADFIAFSPAPPALSSLASLKRPMVPTPGEMPNLLELEYLNKKKKKRRETLGGSSDPR